MDNAEPSFGPAFSDIADEVAGPLLLAVGREEPLTPSDVTLLLRHYLAHGRDEVAAGLAAALTLALEACPSATLSDDRSSWLSVFVEAQGVSEDERLGKEVSALVDTLRREWPARAGVAQAMRSVAACLDAASIGRRVQKDPPYEDANDDGANDPDVGRVLSDPAVDDGLLAAAIDEMERIVASAYEPGEGLSSAPGSDATGTLEDHVHAAAALLAAYRATARLPYSMLAEELMRFARRRWWCEEAGCFSDGARPGAATDGIATDGIVALNCQAVRVLARISALHGDPEYRHAVVVADGLEGVTNFGDADRILAWLGRSYRAHRAVASEYAIALGERLSIR